MQSKVITMQRSEVVYMPKYIHLLKRWRESRKRVKEQICQLESGYLVLWCSAVASLRGTEKVLNVCISIVIRLKRTKSLGLLYRGRWMCKLLRGFHLCHPSIKWEGNERGVLQKNGQSPQAKPLNGCVESFKSQAKNCEMWAGVKRAPCDIIGNGSTGFTAGRRTDGADQQKAI